MKYKQPTKGLVSKSLFGRLKFVKIHKWNSSTEMYTSWDTQFCQRRHLALKTPGKDTQTGVVWWTPKVKKSAGRVRRTHSLFQQNHKDVIPEQWIKGCLPWLDTRMFIPCCNVHVLKLYHLGHNLVKRQMIVDVCATA